MCSIHARTSGSALTKETPSINEICKLNSRRYGVSRKALPGLLIQRRVMSLPAHVMNCLIANCSLVDCGYRLSSPRGGVWYPTQLFACWETLAAVIRRNAIWTFKSSRIPSVKMLSFEDWYEHFFLKFSGNYLDLITNKITRKTRGKIFKNNN